MSDLQTELTDINTLINSYMDEAYRLGQVGLQVPPGDLAQLHQRKAIIEREIKLHENS